METYIVKKKEGKLFLFKKDQEIGQVSPDATWVKEGDKWTEEEFYWGCFPRHEHAEDGSTIWLDEDNELDPERKIPIYNIKGPCGHFH